MWRERHRCGRRGRLPKPITLENIPPNNTFTPNKTTSLEPVFLEFAELEALRLVDLEGMSQEEAGQKMNISRGTIWRLVQSARRKTAQALSQGRPIYVVTGAPDKNT
jgi:uncharacterized protein